MAALVCSGLPLFHDDIMVEYILNYHIDLGMLRSHIKCNKFVKKNEMSSHSRFVNLAEVTEASVSRNSIFPMTSHIECLNLFDIGVNIKNTVIQFLMVNYFV